MKDILTIESENPDHNWLSINRKTGDFFVWPSPSFIAEVAELQDAGVVNSAGAKRAIEEHCREMKAMLIQRLPEFVAEVKRRSGIQ